jgi:hypothetical protein
MKTESPRQQRGCIAGFRKPWNYGWTLIRPRSPVRARRHTAATTWATVHIQIFAGAEGKSKWNPVGEGVEGNESGGLKRSILFNLIGVSGFEHRVARE